MASALFDDLFQGIAWVELKLRDVDRNRCRKYDAVSHPLHLKIGNNRIFLACDISESNQVVFCQVFQLRLREKV